MMEKLASPSMHELCLMLTRSDRAMRAVVSNKLGKQRLTIMEWLALGVISAGSKSGLSMTEVAGALNVTLPQVTALVAGLLDRKYVKQKVLSSDHRGRQVMIALKGKRVLGKLEIAIASSIRTWAKDVPRSRWQEYIRTIKQLSVQAD